MIWRYTVSLDKDVRPRFTRRKIAYASVSVALGMRDDGSFT